METKKYPYVFKEFKEAGDKYRIVITKDDEYEYLITKDDEYEYLEPLIGYEVEVMRENTMGENAWVIVDYDTPGGYRDTIRYLLRLVGAEISSDSE